MEYFSIVTPKIRVM